MGETIDTDAPEIAEGNVVVKDFDKAVLTAQENEPVRITEKIEGKELIVTPKGERLVDFASSFLYVVNSCIFLRISNCRSIVADFSTVFSFGGDFRSFKIRRFTVDVLIRGYVCIFPLFMYSFVFFVAITFFSFTSWCPKKVDDVLCQFANKKDSRLLYIDT